MAYYVGQISSDRSSAFYGGAINVNRYDIWAAGGMIGYNFGPVTSASGELKSCHQPRLAGPRVLRDSIAQPSPRDLRSLPSLTTVSGRQMPPLLPSLRDFTSRDVLRSGCLGSVDRILKCFSICLSADIVFELTTRTDSSASLTTGESRATEVSKEIPASQLSTHASLDWTICPFEGICNSKPSGIDVARLISELLRLAHSTECNCDL